MMANSLLSALTSVAFSVIFNVRGRNLLWAGLCGGLGYAVYAWAGQGRYPALFYAAMAITLLAELIARRAKTPATLFLVGGLLPLVPGQEMFRMFLAVMESRPAPAMTHFWNAILQAGALAAGTIVIGALLHLAALLQKRPSG